MSLPSTSPVQVQIWVDDNAVSTGSTQGVYLVDNRAASGSANEGTPGLTTAISNGTDICWQVFLINPKSESQVTISSIGNSGAWGFSGQPQPASDNPNAYVGTVQNPGQFSYPLAINVQVKGGSGVTLPLNPNLSVSD